MKGPLAPYGSGFYMELIGQGYAPSYAERQMWLMSQISLWMMGDGLRPCDLTTEVVDRLLALRRAQGRKVWISPPAVAPLMGYLRRDGTVPEPSSVARAITELDRLLEEYRAYLFNERGLAPSTVRQYLRVGRLFIVERSDVDGSILKEPPPAEVTAFVLQEVQGRGPARQNASSRERDPCCDSSTSTARSPNL